MLSKPYGHNNSHFVAGYDLHNLKQPGTSIKYLGGIFPDWFNSSKNLLCRQISCPHDFRAPYTRFLKADLWHLTLKLNSIHCMLFAICLQTACRISQQKATSS